VSVHVDTALPDDPAALVAMIVALRANKAETPTPRKFTLEGVR
jgi:hypothetical protein